MGLRDLVRAAFAAAGYRVTRLRPANRFQAMDDTLRLMRSLGYAPAVVIDAGANMGTWTQMARAVFPDAQFHLIEPQPACLPALRALAATSAALTVHPVALTEPGIERVRLIGGGAEGGGTGAWVARPEEHAEGETHCAATTLDSLFADQLTPASRALLKLDVEGHEVPALRGGGRLLGAVEVVLTELQFFETNDNGRPVFADIVTFMRERGFELFDIACLSQRPRDMRLRMGDVVFARRDSPLLADRSWE